jgi:hypothetical protein
MSLKVVANLAALGAVLVLGVSSAFAAPGGCHTVAGGYNQNYVYPCSGIACVDATLTGDLSGVSHTIITGYDAATNTYTGKVTIVRDTGSILTAILKTVSGSGVGTETITGGTRQYTGATGFIVATDTVPFYVGTYKGVYCVGSRAPVR